MLRAGPPLSAQCAAEDAWAAGAGMTDPATQHHVHGRKGLTALLPLPEV
mgnify:CR=1 FL=1